MEIAGRSGYVSKRINNHNAEQKCSHPREIPLLNSGTPQMDNKKIGHSYKITNLTIFLNK